MRAILVLTMLTSAYLASAQSSSNACTDAREAEQDQHVKILAEIQKKRVDNGAKQANERARCGNDRGCNQAAAERYSERTRELDEEARNESARHSKALIDISVDICQKMGRGQTTRTTQPPPETEPPVREAVTPADSTRLFKLSAEMNDLANTLPDTGNPGVEFLKGLADWAGDTLNFLAQKPGVPLQQLGDGIVKYLTNDNAANHDALRGAAEQAVKQFQQNPARFLGQNVPNLLPLPKAGALRQIANVEKAANRVKAIANEERAFAAAYNQALRDGQKFGAARPGSATSFSCYAKNACVPTALAEAELFKTGGPLGNGTPVKIKVRAPDPMRPDMAMTSAQVSERLRGYGDGFAPRRTGTYNPQQLDQIWQGYPISSSPEDIAKILTREGEGSQGIVFTEMHPTFNHKPGDPLGHAFNARNVGGKVEFIDKTTPGMDPLFLAPQVKQWWFFPIP